MKKCSVFKCKFKLVGFCVQASYICLVVLNALNFQFVKSDDSLDGQHSRAKSTSQIVKLNCLSEQSADKNFVHFLDLNISFAEFQQIIDLVPDDRLYLGKKVVYEGSSLAVTCIKRSTTHQQDRTDWYLNTIPIDQLYPTRTKTSKKASKPYQTEQYLCRNLNLVVYKLTIRKAAFMNTGEYQCVDQAIGGQANSKRHFVHVLIIDWNLFNSNFLNQVYFDLLTSNHSKNELVKYCPLSSPTWYKWSTKLDLDNSSIISINESGRYICKSTQLNRQIDFWIFGNYYSSPYVV